MRCVGMELRQGLGGGLAVAELAGGGIWKLRGLIENPLVSKKPGHRLNGPGKVEVHTGITASEADIHPDISRLVTRELIPPPGPDDFVSGGLRV